MNNPSQSTILTVDDDPLVRDAYRNLVLRADGLTLVGEAPDGPSAIAAYEALQPDVVLMDLQMPGMSGIAATEAICSGWPNACVVVLTTFGTREHIVAALRAGASGYLVKDIGGRNLLAGIGQALRGEMPLSPTIRRELVDSVTRDGTNSGVPVDVGLTAREVELLTWLVRGLTNGQIASRMFVSEGSVKQYLTRIGTKLRMRSRTQILIRAIQLNIVDPREAEIQLGD